MKRRKMTFLSNMTVAMEMVDYFINLAMVVTNVVVFSVFQKMIHGDKLIPTTVGFTKDTNYLLDSKLVEITVVEPFADA